MKKEQPFDYDLPTLFERWMHNEQELAEESEFASDKSLFTGEMTMDTEDFFKMLAIIEEGNKRLEYLLEAERKGTLTDEEHLELQDIYDSWND